MAKAVRAQKKTIQMKTSDLKWPFPPSDLATYVNQFLLTRSHDGLYVLEAGQLLLTGFLNRPESEMLEHLHGAPVKPVARVLTTRSGLESIRKMIDERLAQDDADAAT